MDIAQHDYHKRRIGVGVTASIAGGLLVIVAVVFWSLWNVIVCEAQGAGPLQEGFCRVTQVVPDISLVLLLAALGWLLFALDAFAEELRAGGELKVAERKPREWAITHHARKAYHAYGRLEQRHKTLVSFAIEMAGWSGALLIVTVAFYFLQKSRASADGYPALVLGVAVVLRLFYALVRRMISLLRGHTPPPQAPPSAA